MGFVQPWMDSIPPPFIHFQPYRDRVVRCSALDSRILEESPIEGDKHQDDADVHEQPLPEVISEEQQVHAHDDRDHDRHEEHSIEILRHFGSPV